ncbi:MAG: SiaB family protein kinase [Bacteroidia bacterium]|nr:SiaB family protein kinase [Bacteroidia bacterium]MCX7764025.1 SiaB family protein kinase [Bacteroidia bacterium]MDW8058111.1 SiaB family protein kinase [Bacteroidia bacterium]
MTVSYEHRLLFRHEGPLDMEVLPVLVHAAERALQNEGVRPPLRRRIISSLIELAQNIIRYSAVNEKYPPLLLLSRTDQGFVLIVRNLVHYSQELFLHSYLQNLVSMPRQELEKLHYSTLTEGSYSDSGGAGLGLVQVLFKSDAFEYELTPVEGEYSWFTVKASFSL